MSPTQRSLDYCRSRGWHAWVVEKWLPPRGDMPHGRRQDAFGCGDLLVVAPFACGALLIQATSGSNVSARVHKSIDECGEFLRTWLMAGNAFEVWGWAKRKRRGPDGRYWQVRRVSVRRSGERIVVRY